METFKLKKDTWHYKMNSAIVLKKVDFESGVDVYIRSLDYCSYWRMTMKNTFAVGMGILAAIGAVSVVLGGIGYILYMVGEFFYRLFTGEIPIENFLQEVLSWSILFSIFALVFGFVYFFNKRSKEKQKKIREIAQGTYKEPEHGIFKTKYIAWKKKICPSLELIDE